MNPLIYLNSVVNSIVTQTIIDSPLNSYLYVHWILDFKQLLLLLLITTREVRNIISYITFIYDLGCQPGMGVRMPAPINQLL